MAEILEFPTGKKLNFDRVAPATLADILRGLEEALGTNKRIVLRQALTCWTATFHKFNDRLIPEGVAVPLPFTAAADPSTVADHILRRYPDAIITTE